MHPTPRPRRARAARLAALSCLMAWRTAAAQQVEPPPAPVEPTPASRAQTQADDALHDKSYAIPALEIIGFDFLLSRYNRRFSGTTDYDVNGESIRRNLRGPWVVDNDPFQINQFAHPYQGSLYHGAARATGLNYWEASAVTFAGSAWWEITGERTPPSRNDQIASGIAGSFFGEPLFRMAHLLLNRGGDAPGAWREWGAAALSPGLGLNRLVFGSRFSASFSDHDPLYHARLRIGGQHAVRDDIGTSTDFHPDTAEVDFAIDYGLPGKADYTYRRPFDYFSFQTVFSSANGVENLSTRGLLFGTDYALGDHYRGIWGLYGNYDYLAPQIFRVSTTALSLGTTAQWWVSSRTVLQGTGLAGIGYSAANTQRGPIDDRDYHYGVAPRFSLALRLTTHDRVSVDVSAQKYLLGRIANRNAGRDDISRADAAMTWRVAGRHAVGLKYVWSHRSATYPTVGDRSQTLGTVGLFYTLLGSDGFGTVDWRAPAAEGGGS